MNVQYWYQEKWVWFILVLLGASIMAAAAMSIIAIRHSPAEIDSHWYQDGALTKHKRQQVAFIKHLHLHASLTLQGDTMLLQLQHDPAQLNQQQSDILDVAQLSLYIEHPIEPRLDQTVTLRRVKKYHYRGQLKNSLSGKRHCLISPKSELWYLTSLAYFPTQQMYFKPDVA